MKNFTHSEEIIFKGTISSVEFDDQFTYNDTLAILQTLKDRFEEQLDEFTSTFIEAVKELCLIYGHPGLPARFLESLEKIQHLYEFQLELPPKLSYRLQ